MDSLSKPKTINFTANNIFLFYMTMPTAVLVPRISDSLCWYVANVFESWIPFSLHDNCNAFKYCNSEYWAPRSIIVVRISWK